MSFQNFWSDEDTNQYLKIVINLDLILINLKIKFELL